MSLFLSTSAVKLGESSKYCENRHKKEVPSTTADRAEQGKLGSVCSRSCTCTLGFPWSLTLVSFPSYKNNCINCISLDITNTYIRKIGKKYKYMRRQHVPFLPVRGGRRQSWSSASCVPRPREAQPCITKASLEPWLPGVTGVLPREHVRVPWKTLMSGNPLGLISFPQSIFPFSHLRPCFPNFRYRNWEGRWVTRAD